MLIKSHPPEVKESVQMVGSVAYMRMETQKIRQELKRDEETNEH